MITELRCPSCNAPIDIAPGGARMCRYCGASIVLGTPEGGLSGRFRTEERFVVVASIGPSNAERAAKALCSSFGMSSAEAESAARGGRCEIDAGTDRGRAGLFASSLRDAGADADVVSREMAIPVVAVLLEETGARKPAVMAALINNLDRTRMNLAQAKTLVEHTPCTVIEAIDADKGRALLAALEAAGARASLR